MPFLLFENNNLINLQKKYKNKKVDRSYIMYIDIDSPFLNFMFAIFHLPFIHFVFTLCEFLL